MTNLEQYARSVQTETWWGYFFSRGCGACPAQSYCHAQPSGTCCRENFMQWAGEETAGPPNEALTLEELRGMDGEPVWAGNEKEPQHFQWFIVDCDSAYKPFILINRQNNLMWQYMKSPAHPGGWTAYRRKRR